MILLFAALAVGRAWSVELVVTDPTVGGVLTVPADGAELSIRLGEPSGPHIPVLREVVVRRFGERGRRRSSTPSRSACTCRTRPRPGNAC